MSGYRVRPAGFHDLAHMVPLATALAASFGGNFPKPDPLKIDAELRRALRRGFVLVCEADGTIDGLLALERGEFPWSSETVLVDRGFYATPGTGAGGMLALAARNIGRVLNLPVYITRLGEAVTRL